MILKTLCNNCVFVNEDRKCGLQKDTFCENFATFTEGYCSQKSVDFLKDEEVIIDESQHLSFVYISLDNNLEQIKFVVDLTQNFEKIKEIVVFCQTPSQEESSGIREILRNSGKAYRIETLMQKEEVNLESIEHNSAFIVNSNWFVVTDKVIPYDRLCVFFETIEDPKNSYASVTTGFEEDFMPRNAFISIDGHNEISYHDKIKTFDNWEKICKSA